MATIPLRRCALLVPCLAMLAGPVRADGAAGQAAFARGDYAVALREFTAPAEAGDAEARYFVGLIHAKGLGVPHDYVAARHWYALAAAQGYAHAQDALALLYANGWGTARDYVQAWMWFELARRHFPEGTDRQVAFKSRELIARRMTAGEVAEARRLAAAWKAGP